MSEGTKDHPNRIIVLLDDQDRAALNEIIAEERLTLSDVVRRLIREKAREISDSKQNRLSATGT